MSSPSSASLVVLFPQEGEGWSGLTKRLHNTKGELLLILSGREEELIDKPEVRATFIKECKKMQARLRIATKHPAIASEARGAGIRVLDRTTHVRHLLHGNPKLNEALRVFSPQLWRQQLKSRLQRIGLLSVPKLRIFSLMGLSVILFSIVIFRLLPSADVYIRPRQESVSQTVNIFLVQSGATADISNRVRHMPLVPLTVHVSKSLTFDHISKEFIGSSSKVALTVVNKAEETYALREGTRFANQAGMVFRIKEHAIVEPGKEVTVPAVADDVDLYDQIIGERGNVPAGLKWEIPGLAPQERSLVYGINKAAGAGGTTAYRTVLRQEDLDIARKRLEQELLTMAKQMAEELRVEQNQQQRGTYLQMLNYTELTTATYSGVVLPTQFLGEVVTSVPIQGSVEYTIFAYDAERIFTMLLEELRSHVREGRTLIDEELTREHLVVHVIDYADDLSWIKLTVDLSATEEYILDPLSPTGALFGKKVRESIVGLPYDEAVRIVRNMPEVERVEIKQWPPWSRGIPHIASHISIQSF